MGMWLYFVMLFSFAGISIALKQYYVAGLELALTILLLVLGTKIIVITSWLSVQDIAVYLMLIVGVYSGVEYFITNRNVLKGSMGK